MRSCPDLRAFMSRLSCVHPRLKCVHVQTFVRSCPDFRAFIPDLSAFMSRLLCVHVQTFGCSPDEKTLLAGVNADISLKMKKPEGSKIPQIQIFFVFFFKENVRYILLVKQESSTAYFLNAPYTLCAFKNVHERGQTKTSTWDRSFFGEPQNPVETHF